MIFNHGRYWHEMENWDTCQILKATRCRWLWSQFQLYLPYLNSKFAWCFHRFLIMKVLIYRFFLNKETALIVGVFSKHYETSLRCVESWARHWVAAWDCDTGGIVVQSRVRSQLESCRPVSRKQFIHKYNQHLPNKYNCILYSHYNA